MLIEGESIGFYFKQKSKEEKNFKQDSLTAVRQKKKKRNEDLKQRNFGLYLLIIRGILENISDVLSVTQKKEAKIRRQILKSQRSSLNKRAEHRAVKFFTFLFLVGGLVPFQETSSYLPTCIKGDQ